MIQSWTTFNFIEKTEAIEIPIKKAFFTAIKLKFSNEN